MSRADRRRIRRTLATAAGVHDARATVLARYDTCTPDQRRRIAWHALTLLPEPVRLEVLERHLPTFVAPADVTPLASEISRRLEPAHRVPGRRLAALRYDVP